EIRRISRARVERISDSKPHEQSVESSLVFGFEVPKRGCQPKARNFKSTTLVWQIRNSPYPGARVERISDSKPHEQSIESSVVFGFEVPKRGCQRKARNFKSNTLVWANPKFAASGGES